MGNAALEQWAMGVLREERDGKARSTHARRVQALAQPLAAALRTWLARAVAIEIAKATRDPTRYTRGAKQLGDERDLISLLLRFGMRRVGDAANGEGATLDGSLISDAIEGKPVRISFFQEHRRGIEKRAAGMTEEVQERVRESVRGIVDGAASEGLSTGELARRIARTIHAVEPEEGGEPGRAYVFSFERAEVIARTEMGQAENTGKMVGFEALGVEEIEWLAYGDGRSGDRHHERMDGKRIKLGGTFTTPLGNRLRYPCDTSGPAEDVVNCRCTVRAVPVGQR